MFEKNETVFQSTTQAAHKLPPQAYGLYTSKSFVTAFAASLIYFVASYFLVGFKTDQLFLIALFNILFFASAVTRKFIIGFSIFIIYWIIFDWMKAFPNYQYNQVSIAELYNAEKGLFGFTSDENIITPNEYFGLHHSSFADVATGIFYLCWVPVPLAFAAIMFFKNRKIFFEFAFSFFLVNLIGFVGYYVYPAAPPWYVAQYGFDFIANTPGNAAALSRFDALTGIPVFAGIYSKSSNVFAAMPSLHAAYMLIATYYAIKAKWGWWILLFAFVTIGIWFSAVYTNHHYILDVLAGIACAIVGTFLFQLMLKKIQPFQNFINRLSKHTT